MINELVKRGYISGWELVDRNLKNTRFYGVENKIIYDENLRSMRISFAYRKKLDEVYNSLKPIFEFGKSRVYSSALMEFEELEAEHNRGEISFADWTQCFNVEGQNHPNLILFQKLEQLKKTLNMPKISTEAANVMSRISRYLSKNEQVALQTARASEGFYEYLKDLLRAKNIRINENYPQLAQYFYYLDLKGQINMLQFINELGRATYEKKLKIAGKNEAMKKLIYAERYLKIFEAYINNEASQSQVEDWQSESKRFFEVMKGLNQKLSSNHVIENNETKILEAKANMDNFYELANKRNEIMLRNMLGEMARTNTTKGVLVVGGYHGKVIAEMLRAQGISYELIMPVINSDDKDHTTENLRKKVYMSRIQEECQRLKLNVGEKVSENDDGQNTGITTGGLDSRRSLSSTALEKSGGSDGNDDGAVGKVLALSQYPEILTKAMSVVGEMKGLTNNEIIEFYKALGLDKKIEQLPVPAIEKQKEGELSAISSITGLTFLHYICLEKGIDIVADMSKLLPNAISLLLTNIVDYLEKRRKPIDKKFENIQLILKQKLELALKKNFIQEDWEIEYVDSDVPGIMTHKNGIKTKVYITKGMLELLEEEQQKKIDAEFENLVEQLMEHEVREQKAGGIQKHDEILKQPGQEKVVEFLEKVEEKAADLWLEKVKGIIQNIQKDPKKDTQKLENILKNASDKERISLNKLLDLNKEYFGQDPKILALIIRYRLAQPGENLLEKIIKFREQNPNLKYTDPAAIKFLSDLCGCDFNYYLKDTQLTEIMGNILAFEGKDTKNKQSLEGSIIHRFISLHVLSLGQLLFDLVKNGEKSTLLNDKNDKKVDNDELNILLDLIVREFEIALEIRRNYVVFTQTHESGHRCGNELIKAEAENIAEQISKIGDGEYVIPAGWDVHRIYVVFRVLKGQLFVRIDNLGSELSRHTQSGTLTFPYAYQAIPQSKIQNAQINVYIQGIFNVQPLKNEPQTKEIPATKIYSAPMANMNRMNLNELQNTYSALKGQTAGNCTVENYFAGMYMRLGGKEYFDLVKGAEAMILTHKKVLAAPTNTEIVPQQLPVKPLKALALTQESTKKLLFEKLKQHYSGDEYQKISLLMEEQQFDIEKCYVQLAIVKEEEQKKKEGEQNNKGQEISGLQNTYEDIYAAKENIELQQLFDIKKAENKGGGTAKQMILLGRAGIGKSTICKRIVTEWAKGAAWLSKFDYVFLIPLRNLNKDRYPTKEEMVDIIITECYGELSQNERELLKEMLEKNGDKILYILDGYDELQEPDYLKPQIEKLKKQPNVLITSRPAVGLPDVDVKVENIGFSDKQIDDYIDMFFRNKEAAKGDRLKEFLNKNTNIRGIGHIPINLELLCSLWDGQEQRLQKQDQGMTITELYEKMNVQLYKKYLEKWKKDIEKKTPNQILRKCENEKKVLSYLAYEGMLEGKIILNGELIEEAIDNISPDMQVEELDHIGLLKPKEDNEYYFLHLTFQEYYAAMWLCDYGTADEIKNFIYENKYKPQYQVMLSFIAGILNERGKTKELIQFFEWLEAEPRLISGEDYHRELLIRCFDQCKQVSEFYENEKIKKILEGIYNWIDINFRANRYDIKQEIGEYIIKRYKNFFSNKKIIEILVKILTDDKVGCSVREGAVQALVKSGKADKEIIDVLVEFLRDEKVDSYYRDFAVEALGKLGKINKEAVDALVKILTDDKVNIWMRISAAEALGNLGKADKEIIDVLVKVLTDDKVDYWVRRHAAEALGKLGKTDKEIIDALVKVLADDKVDKWLRLNAAETLGKLGKADKEVIEALVEFLTDDKVDNWMRQTAAEALGKLGKADKEAVDALLKVLTDDKIDNWVRQDAAEALGNLGKTDKEVIDALVKVLTDDKVDSSVRSSAASALGKLGKADKEVIDALVKFLTENEVDFHMREYVAEAFVKLGKADKEELVKVLTDDKVSFFMREYVAKALMKLGKADKKVIDALVKVLTDDKVDNRVREHAAEALGNLGKADKEVIDALVKVLTDDKVDYYVREHAAEALGKLGKADKEVIDALVKILTDDKKVDYYVRGYAAKALGKLGKADKEVIDALVAALKDKDSSVREDAAEALGKLGNSDKEVIDALIKVLTDDKYEYAREDAAKALGKLGKAEKEVIDALVKVLTDDKVDYDVREYAAEALGNLGNLGKADKEIIDALVKVLTDDKFDYHVRKNAVKRVKREETLGKETLRNLIKQNISIIPRIPVKFLSEILRLTSFTMIIEGWTKNLNLRMLVAVIIKIKDEAVPLYIKHERLYMLKDNREQEVNLFEQDAEKIGKVLKLFLGPAEEKTIELLKELAEKLEPIDWNSDEVKKYSLDELIKIFNQAKTFAANNQAVVLQKLVGQQQQPQQQIQQQVPTNQVKISATNNQPAVPQKLVGQQQQPQLQIQQQVPINPAKTFVANNQAVVPQKVVGQQQQPQLQIQQKVPTNLAKTSVENNQQAVQQKLVGQPQLQIQQQVPTNPAKASAVNNQAVVQQKLVEQQQQPQLQIQQQFPTNPAKASAANNHVVVPQKLVGQQQQPQLPVQQQVPTNQAKASAVNNHVVVPQKLVGQQQQPQFQIQQKVPTNQVKTSATNNQQSVQQKLVGQPQLQIQQEVPLMSPQNKQYCLTLLIEDRAPGVYTDDSPQYLLRHIADNPYFAAAKNEVQQYSQQDKSLENFPVIQNNKIKLFLSIAKELFEMANPTVANSERSQPNQISAQMLNLLQDLGGQRNTLAQEKLFNFLLPRYFQPLKYNDDYAQIKDENIEITCNNLNLLATFYKCTNNNQILQSKIEHALKTNKIQINRESRKIFFATSNNQPIYTLADYQLSPQAEDMQKFFKSIQYFFNENLNRFSLKSIAQNEVEKQDDKNPLNFLTKMLLPEYKTAKALELDNYANSLVRMTTEYLKEYVLAYNNGSSENIIIPNEITNVLQQSQNSQFIKSIMHNLRNEMVIDRNNNIVRALYYNLQQQPQLQIQQQVPTNQVKNNQQVAPQKVVGQQQQPQQQIQQQVPTNQVKNNQQVVSQKVVGQQQQPQFQIQQQISTNQTKTSAVNNQAVSQKLVVQQQQPQLQIQQQVPTNPAKIFTANNQQVVPQKIVVQPQQPQLQIQQEAPLMSPQNKQYWLTLLIENRAPGVYIDDSPQYLLRHIADNPYFAAARNEVQQYSQQHNGSLSNFPVIQDDKIELFLNIAQELFEMANPVDAESERSQSDQISAQMLNLLQDLGGQRNTLAQEKLFNFLLPRYFQPLEYHDNHAQIKDTNIDITTKNLNLLTALYKHTNNNQILQSKIEHALKTNKIQINGEPRRIFFATSNNQPIYTLADYQLSPQAEDMQKFLKSIQYFFNENLNRFSLKSIAQNEVAIARLGEKKPLNFLTKMLLPEYKTAKALELDDYANSLVRMTTEYLKEYISAFNGNNDQNINVPNEIINSLQQPQNPQFIKSIMHNLRNEMNINRENKVAHALYYNLQEQLQTNPAKIFTINKQQFIAQNTSSSGLNCLFHSLLGTEQNGVLVCNTAQEERQKLIELMKQNSNQIKQNKGVENFNQEIQKISNNQQIDVAIVGQLLANKYQKNIIVKDARGEQYDAIFTVENAQGTLYIFYNGVNHFERLEPVVEQAQQLQNNLTRGVGQFVGQEVKQNPVQMMTMKELKNTTPEQDLEKLNKGNLQGNELYNLGVKYGVGQIQGSQFVLYGKSSWTETELKGMIKAKIEQIIKSQQSQQKFMFVGLRQGAKMLAKLATITSPFVESHHTLREALSKKLPQGIQDIKFLSQTVEKSCFIGIIDGNLVMTTDIAEKLENIKKTNPMLFDRLTTELLTFEKSILDSLSFEKHVLVKTGKSQGRVRGESLTSNSTVQTSPNLLFTKEEEQARKGEEEGKNTSSNIYESAVEAERAVVASETNTKLLKAFRNLLEYERDLTEHRLTMTSQTFQDIWKNLEDLTETKEQSQLETMLKNFENLNKIYEQLKGEDGVLRREVIIPVDEKVGDVLQRLNSLNCLDKSGKIREDVQVTFIGDLSPENIKKLKFFVGTQNMKWVIGKKSVERMLVGDKDLLELVEKRIAVEMQVRNNGEILIDAGFVGVENKKRYDKIIDKMTDGNRTVCDRASDMAEITNGMLRVLARMAAEGISVEDVKSLSDEKLIELLRSKNLSQIIHGQYDAKTIAEIVRQAIDLHFGENGIMKTSVESKFSDDKIRQVSSAEILGIIRTLKTPLMAPSLNIHEQVDGVANPVQRTGIIRTLKKDMTIEQKNEQFALKVSDILLTETHVTGFEMNAVIAEGKQLPEEMKNMADIAENMELRGNAVLTQVEMKGFEKLEYDVKKAVSRVRKVLIDCLSKFVGSEETSTVINKLFDEIIDEETLRLENFADRINNMKAVAAAA